MNDDESFTREVVVVDTAQADADDVAVHLASEYRSRGYDVRFVQTRVRGLLTVEVQIFDEGHWRTVDTAPRIPLWMRKPRRR